VVLVMVVVVMVVRYVFTRVALHVHGDPLVMHHVSVFNACNKKEKLFLKIFVAIVLTLKIFNKLFYASHIGLILISRVNYFAQLILYEQVI
jgi:hypothetical protein